MEHFFLGKEALKAATVEEMAAAIMCVCHTDNFNGNGEAEAYNEAHKAAASIQTQVLASQHRALCSAAQRRAEDHWW